MRILLVTDTHDETRGGAEKYFFKLKRKLLEEGHDVYSLGFGLNEKVGRDFFVIRETKSLFWRHFWRMFFNYLMYKKIRKIVREINPDIIHIHNINKYTPSLLLALKGYKIVMTVHDYGLVCPTLWNVHDDLEPCPTGMRFRCIHKHKRNYSWPIYLSMVWAFYLKRALLKRVVSVYISPSPQLNYYLEINGFNNVHFIPNFVQISDSQPHFEKMNLNQIAYIGQLEENKGVHILIDALALVVKKKPDVKLKIAGRGSLAEKLREKVNKLGLNNNVEFLGFVENVSGLIQGSAFIVVPSIVMDNAPLVIQEAMTSYRPVIGSDRGGIPWLVQDNETGLIYNALDSKELSVKILYLLNEPNIIKDFGYAAFDRIKEISGQGNVKKIVEVYNQLI